MDSTEWENVVPQLTEKVNQYARSSGNSNVEAVKVFKILFPAGIAGKEQDAFSMKKIVDVMFQIANSTPETANTLWKELCAYALTGLKASE